MPWWAACFLLALLLFSCKAAKKPGAADTPRNKPGAGPVKPRLEPVDTIRWKPAPAGTRPPITSSDEPIPTESPLGNTYRIGLLLPFLSSQFDETTNLLPEKSNLALQFYAGARLALQQLSTEDGLNLVVDVYDTQINDADFQKLLNNPRLEKAQVFIGPVRASHVSLLAERIRNSRQILVSPESPNAGLTTRNPDFIQINPSLRAHCEVIARHVRSKRNAEDVVLVCKQKEADRLPYFQAASEALGGGRMQELIVPDATLDFEKTDFKPYFKPGKTPVFIVPSWSSQDFVMALLRKLKSVKGATRVEVYGMPQWQTFENIEPEYFADLNVHVSSAAYVDYTAPEVRAFQLKFYENYGTIPDSDAFNGYDVTLFTGKMLKKYGLSFPQRLAREDFAQLQGHFQFTPIGFSGAPDDPSGTTYDYLENTFVHLLKFEKFGFVPLDR